MSGDNTEEATWTSSRANAIKEQLEIESNKIMLPNADGTGQHQDTTKVPVHSDDVKEALPIFEIDRKYVLYNFDNVRLWKYKKKKCIDLGTEKLDPSNEAHQNAIEDLLLNTKAYSNVQAADLKLDIAKKGQEDAALITPVGVLWNGNRRCAVLSDFYKNGFRKPNVVTIPAGDAKYNRIKVAVLPADLDLKQLRDLEKRLQQKPHTEEEYGRVNEMGDIHDRIHEHPFDNGSFNDATSDEKKYFEKEFGDTEWKTWNKIIRAKKCIELMDDYLQSRHTENTPLIGNYQHIEEGIGGVTWFENLVLQLDEVGKYFDANPDRGDKDAMILGFQENAFSAYETGDVEQKRLRQLTSSLQNATGDGDVKDTQPLLDSFIQNSPIIQKAAELQAEPEKIDTLVHQAELAKESAKNFNILGRNMEQHGQDPKLIITGINSELKNSINENLIQPNDQELVRLCDIGIKRLNELKEKAKAS